MPSQITPVTGSTATTSATANADSRRGIADQYMRVLADIEMSTVFYPGAGTHKGKPTK
jgi:hypothetical protein